MDIKKPLTTPLEEGPCYMEGSPERTSIAGDTPGIPLTLTGRVFDPQGNPVAHAWMDFWHADSNGLYDNEGFNLRGHQYTDAEGRYHLETIRPRWYETRTAHVHVKVRPTPHSPVFTTQLFFSGEPLNETDDIFAPGTVMMVEMGPEQHRAVFDFVVEV